MKLPAERPLEAAIAGAWPGGTWRDSHVVLAVSGGADSVAMLRAMLFLKQQAGGPGRLFVAHLNHTLRGATADEDQAWVGSLCRRLDVPLEVGRVDVAQLADAEGDSWEAAARKARYEFLCQAAEKVGARFVAVAHTADDQAETVLHRVVRGTGLAGLAGMSAFRPLSKSVSLVRPLLNVRRSEVLRYLDSIGQEYRTDASNADRRWTRNRLRNELLPELRDHYNSEVDDALRRLALQASEAQAFIAGACAGLVSRSIDVQWTAQGTSARIDCRVLADQPPIVIREVCKAAWSHAGWPMQAMGFDEWQQLAGLVLAKASGASLNLPGGVRACRDGESAVLEGKLRSKC